MVEGLLWFGVILNLVACAINTHSYFTYRKLIKKENEEYKKQILLNYGKRRELFKELGAYKTENGKMYIDLEGGLRLVIFENKIEGWYMT